MEMIALRAAHPLPEGAAGLVLRGLRADIGLTLWTAAALAIPVLLLAWRSPRAAAIVHRIALVLVVILGVLLAQYFAVTFVPLGSDLYGYSLREIRQTAGASKGVGVVPVIVLIGFAALAWFATGIVQRIRLSERAAVALLGVIAFSVLVRSAFTLSRGRYPSDAAYYLATSKTVYFAQRSIEHFRGGTSDGPGPALSGYPLVHAATHDDVLGPLFNLGATPPNLVFIIVEGLGRDFVGPGARYGGFTPFIDSLASRGLFWSNFLSTTGRTFGVLPSLLASAPFGQDGFAELGERMPGHLSLVTLLGKAGYRTEYFTGTQGHFDNIDVFMRRENVDRFVDQGNFGAAYQKQPAASGGDSWGYADQDLFKRSLEIIPATSQQPRLDTYLTITTHEPFIPPHTTEYDAKFAQRLASLPGDDGWKQQVRENAAVFRTLLYLDDAVRFFIGEYAKRPDFSRTIFVLTGDHRLIPIPEAGRLDRYRVPFIVSSPMVKTARTFPAVSTHLDVAPSILSMLEKRYDLAFPDSVAWLGTGLDTASAFRNAHRVAFMRTKNVLEDYLDGTTLLSGDELFRVRDGLSVEPISDGGLRDSLRSALARFKQVNQYVTAQDRLYPGAKIETANPTVVAAQDSAFRLLPPADTIPDRAFKAAQRKAFAGDYVGARLIAGRLARVAPNDHDSRTLVGRTYAWQKQYDSARAVLSDIVRRAPEYADASAALIDVEIWSGHPAAALERANAALASSPVSAELLFGKAKALEQLKRRREALAVLDTLARIDPSFDGAAAVRQRLGAK